MILVLIISSLVVYISARLCFNKLVDLMECDDKFLKRFAYIATFFLLLSYYMLFKLVYGILLNE